MYGTCFKGLNNHWFNKQVTITTFIQPRERYQVENDALVKLQNNLPTWHVRKIREKRERERERE